MARKRITMSGVEAVIEPLHGEKEYKYSFNIDEFLKLHEQFMTVNVNIVLYGKLYYNWNE